MYRIENIREIRWNNKPKIAFRAFELKENAYVFCGEFLAPIGTPKKNLKNFIGGNNDNN